MPTSSTSAPAAPRNRYRDLLAGKHDATLLRTPFEVLAREPRLQRARHRRDARRLPGHRGLRAPLLGARARGERDRLPARLQGGVDFVYDPANRDVVEALLVANIRDMTPALAKQSYDLLLAPRGGLTRDLRPDEQGIRTVLALRSKYATPQKTLGDPARVRRPHVVRQGVPCSVIPAKAGTQ